MTHVLRTWFRDHRRPLPWRVDRDPYRVWVAEVLLQQTRVTQATPYFERFVRAFPTVERLARAPEGHVLKVWQGAGYYARARHLHDAARRIVRERAGRFPTTVDGWEELPGVGPYIARAVASLVDETPVVALEANGLRVAARWIREEGDLRTPVVRDRLERVLANLLPRETPGEFNEAVMELGETICRPVAPSCPDCPVRFACRARRELADPGSIPVRSPTARRPHVRAAIAVVGWNDRRLVQRQPAGGLLGGLWEFPGGKIEPGERPIEAAAREFAEETGLRTPALAPARGRSPRLQPLLRHLARVPGEFSRTPAPGGLGPDRRWVTSAELGRLPAAEGDREDPSSGSSPADRASRGSGSRPGRTPSGPRGGARPRTASELPVQEGAASSDPTPCSALIVPPEGTRGPSTGRPGCGSRRGTVGSTTKFGWRLPSPRCAKRCIATCSRRAIASIARNISSRRSSGTAMSSRMRWPRWSSMTRLLSPRRSQSRFASSNSRIPRAALCGTSAARTRPDATVGLVGSVSFDLEEEQGGSLLPRGGPVLRQPSGGVPVEVTRSRRVRCPGRAPGGGPGGRAGTRGGSRTMSPRRTAGSGSSRTVTSVANPRVPSLPMKSGSRSGPTERFSTRLPRWTGSPVPRTASTSRTHRRVGPYR